MPRLLLPLILLFPGLTQGDDPQQPPEEACSETNLAACDADTLRGWLQWMVITGPDQVERRLSMEALAADPMFPGKRMAGWRERKKRLRDKHGVGWGIEYVGALMHASEGAGDRTAWGAALRFYGMWEATGRDRRNSGALIWKLEHRHAYGSLPAPADLAGEVGYLGLLHSTLTDGGPWLANLYWRQRMRDGNFVFAAGWVDVGDYVDSFVLGDPWTHFFNAAFQIGGGTMPVPSEGLGFAMGGYLADKVYLLGGFADANSDPSRPRDSVENFFDDQEYFSHLELGWKRPRRGAFLSNAHLTLWHVDERIKAGTPSGWGAALAWTRVLDLHWTTFLRLGYAEESGSDMELSASAGFAWSKSPLGNQLGLGLNWSRPNRDTFGPGLPNQVTLESYYRIQLFEEFSLTPNVQLVLNPALNPANSSLLVLGLRARLAF